MKHPVIITDGSQSAKKYSFRLWLWGLRRTGKGYAGNVSNAQAKKLREFCKKNHLHFAYNNAYGHRGGMYRAKYFAAHPPTFGRYRCVYCGKWLKKEDIVVDHIYPIARVSRDRKLQKLLQKRGIKGVNDVGNLAASCKECNAKKGTQIGKWVKRARERKIYRFVFVLLLIILIVLTICFFQLSDHITFHTLLLHTM